MKRFKLLLACMLLTIGASAAGQGARPARPRLVVGIMVDQMRWDYLYTRSGEWGDGGFARLLSQGYSFNNTMIDYVPTVTACGHASVYTGTTPALHGIAANTYLLDGRFVSSVKDPQVQGVPASARSGDRSPRNLIATTLADQLQLGTDFQAHVVSISLKDRAAILPGGHHPDGAYWYDASLPGFITSTHYATSLPGWVERFNREHRAELATDVWDLPTGVDLTFGMATEALRNEPLGTDDVPDLLALSVSTTDAAAHIYGTDADSVSDIYRELDRCLADFLTELDERVGQGNYLVFLTADHGGTHSQPFMTRHGLASSFIWQPDQARRQANEWLKARFGVDNLLERDLQFSFYLNHAAIEQAGLDRDAVAAAAVQALRRQPGVQWAIDLEHVAQSPVPPELRERLARGYYPGRSGEIFVMLLTGGYSGNPGEHGSNHGSWSQSDSHIPLVFMGWGIPAGETSRQTHITDIAPTVCALLHIQAPNACIGQPLF